MIDDWYAVEAIDPQTFAINEPKSSQYNTSYLIIGDTLMTASLTCKLMRRGYARQLMHDAEDRVRAAGADVMRLDAFDANPRACALYVGLGYRHAGHVRFRKGLFRCYEKRLHAEERGP